MLEFSGYLSIGSGSTRMHKISILVSARYVIRY